MTLLRYTVEVVRHERQTVTFTADDADMSGSDMQRAVAHAYADHHAWVRDPGLEISGLKSVPVAPPVHRDVGCDICGGEHHEDDHTESWKEGDVEVIRDGSGAIVPVEMSGPHSRACGMSYHQHGPLCSKDCPTCNKVKTS